MNFLRSFISGREESKDPNVLITIPAGKFYLSRPASSVKGTTECLYNDAQIEIRKTSTAFCYQLAVQKVYDESEDVLSQEEDDDDADQLLDARPEDERTFLIAALLKISYTSNSDGNVVIAWKNLESADGEYFEFVCDKKVSPKAFDEFDFIAKKAQWEMQHQTEFKGSAKDLEPFDFDFDYAVPVVADVPAEPLAAAAVATPDALPSEQPAAPAADPQLAASDAAPSPDAANVSADTTATPVPASASTIPAGNVLFKESVSLHLFDASIGAFVEQADKCSVEVIETEPYAFYFCATTDERSQILGSELSSDVNPVFNFEHLSFIFNVFSDSMAYSWLFKFATLTALEAFQTVFMQALWESTNKKRWAKVSAADKDYLIEQMDGMDLDSDEWSVAGSDDEEEDTDDGHAASDKNAASHAGKYDEDEEWDDDDKEYQEFKLRKSGGEKFKNSLLSVGLSNNRSYVVNGDKIGVFKQGRDGIEFHAAIEAGKNAAGEVLDPSKMMLHTKDTSLVFQSGNDMQTLYNMDLEYGKIVDEWKVSDYFRVNAFGPTEKFSQLTDNKMLTGISDKAVFHIDPRLDSQSKIVDSTLKVSATNIQNSALATSDNGHVAVATRKGEIRLYDRVGINAKTHLPAIGDPIIGIDVSADGKWLLATCKTYLLLIDVTIKDGKNAGASGFLKSFPAQHKPRPKRLQINPEHVAYMQMEVGKPLSFTPAKFNSGLDSRINTIVTSSGPYVITWNLKKALKGDKDAYLIKRYQSNVADDNFKFGTDKEVIIALENDVTMANKRVFRKATRESIAPTGGVQPLSRSSIVKEY